jgi:hypothetical protein
MQLWIVKPMSLASIARGALLLDELRRSAYRAAVMAGTLSAVGCPNKAGGAA